MRTQPLLRWCAVFATVCSILIVAALLTFKTGNTDFWWHLKAGGFQLHHGVPITSDPFAWTRVGQPYLATHEWLFEILLYVGWASMGVWGILIIRIFFVGGALLAPLFLCKKQFHLYAPIAAVTALTVNHAVSDRPQLSTFFLFSLTATLCMAYQTSAYQKRILVALPLIIVIWVNLHGAAALLGLCLLGTLIADQTAHTLMKERLNPRLLKAKLFPLILTMLAMIVALCINPDGTQTLEYLVHLYTDRSAGFISEWQPSTPSVFLLRNGTIALLAVVFFVFARESFVMSILMFGGLLFLAKSAVRHEPLLAIVSLVIIARQLSSKTWSTNMHVIRTKHALAFCAGSLIITTLIGSISWKHMLDSNRFDTFAGVGAFAPLSGAASYLHKTGIPKRTFNNYNAGGELIFHDIPVFLDGRNLDYGYEYINRAVNAGTDRAAWVDLDSEYDFDAAVIAYYLQSDLEKLPYTGILNIDPEWQLVYLDDWTAVYRKKATMTADELSQYAITQIIPRELAHMELPEEIHASDLATLENELLRMIDEQPNGINPTLYLAKLYASLGLYAASQEYIDSAKEKRPRNFLVWEEQGLLYAEQDRYADAGEALEKSILYAGSDGAVINYQALANIFEKAGNEEKAEMYREKIRE